jgi:hypothetical protein
MKGNMGTIDRTVRLIAVAIVAGLYFTGQISGTIAIVLSVLAVIFLVTSIIGFCPLYAPLKLSTKKQSQSVDAAHTHS